VGKFGPTEADYQAIVDFATTNGLQVKTRYGNRALLDVEGSVSDIEKALHISMRTYHHPTEARDFYAPDTEPSLDSGVQVLHVQGLDNFALPHPNLKPEPVAAVKERIPKAGSGPGGTYMGKDFRAAYVPGVSLDGSGQTVGLFEFDGYYGNDIANYENQAGIAKVPLQNVLVNGVSGTPGYSGISGAVGEVSLDIEMAIAMAPGLSKVVIFEGNLPNSILNSMAANTTIKQFSTSWSWGSSPDTTTDQIFKQMAAQGQSFYNASGDSDAYTGATGEPNDNPYITIVGGTTLSTTGPGGSWTSETVWNWGYSSSSGGYIGSSGGVSTYYSIPTWQQSVSMTASLGSTTMRNIPDVAMAADGVWVIYSNGLSGSFGGTSCATPLWAAFTALVNQQAAAGGKPSVGFINPAIYALGTGPNYAATFHDITTGNNTTSASPSKYYAVPGYDLCTGWGTPNGAALINALAPIIDAPVVVTNGWSLAAETCLPSNGAVDPGETVTVNFGLRNTGTLDTGNLVATLLPNADIIAPSAPQIYGALSASGPTISLPFTFTAGGACGGSIVASLQLQDGATNLGTVSFTLPLGKLVTIGTLTQGFDGVTAPALPAGWSNLVVAGTPASWFVTNGVAAGLPNSAFAPDAATRGVNDLVSPAVPIRSSSAQLTFRHNYVFESNARRSGVTYYDGGVLEIRVGNGAFTDIVTAGGSFGTGGYNATLTTSSDNPLGGRKAWGGSSGGWITTTVNLPASAVGQNIQLRWGCATDTGNAHTAVGWYLDSVSLQDAYHACCSSPAVSPIAPLITTDPGDFVAVAGTTASFSVDATGTSPLSFQWYFNGTNLLAEATASTLQLTNVQPAQAGLYSVLVTNAGGSVLSHDAALRVLVPPTLPASNLVLSDSGVSLSFLSVAGLNYALEYKTSLTDSNWLALPAIVSGDGTLIQLQDTNTPPQPGSRFYRVRCF
jgi:hypothetical protein